MLCTAFVNWIFEFVHIVNHVCAREKMLPALFVALTFSTFSRSHFLSALACAWVKSHKINSYSVHFLSLWVKKAREYFFARAKYNFSFTWHACNHILMFKEFCVSRTPSAVLLGSARKNVEKKFLQFVLKQEKINK